ncbi:MAG: DUF2339 domain-containing protein [Thermosynechococcaceae cyanobacterium]
MAENTDLEQRIAALEAVVIELQQTLAQLTREQSSTTQAKVSSESQEPPAPLLQDERIALPVTTEPREAVPSQRVAVKVDGVKREEFWLNRLGIGLLLLGVAFLFKYSIDQGWIVPAVRIGFGLGLGTLLLVLGWRLESQRTALSQILIGGSIGTFYLTGFAAYQRYQLLTYPIAFVWMVGVTLLAFLMSLRSQQPVLSVVGTLGGLGTPFLLYSGQGSPVGLVAYTCVILIGTSAIYLRQGWQSLLWTAYIGAVFIFGWSIFGTASLQLIRTYGAAASRSITYLDLTVMQIGFLIGWVAFSIVPIVEVLQQLRRSHQDRQSIPLTVLKTPTLYVLSFLTPICLLFATGLIWRLDSKPLGWITIAVAILYGLWGYALRQRNLLKTLGNIHWLTAVVLFSLALPALIEGHILLVLLALEALGLHLIARRTAAVLLIPAHLLAGTVGFWLLVRFYDSVGKISFLNIQALTDLAAMALLLGASLLLKAKPVARFYQLMLHFCMLAWLWRELSMQGAGYVTVAWGCYAIALLVMGLQKDRLSLRWAGMATLVLSVFKLLSYDLANLDALWRIFLFLGFGAVFLGLSYALQDLWKPRSALPQASSKVEQDQ